MQGDAKGTTGMNETERYELICRPAIDELKSLIQNTAKQTADIHKAIFVGNGTKSIMVQMTEGSAKMAANSDHINVLYGRISGIIKWVGGIVAGILVSVIATGLIIVIFKR